MYSVEFAGYCDFSLLVGLEIPICWRVCLVEEEDGVDGVRELLLTDSRRGRGGKLLFGVPLLRIDRVEAVRVDRKDDSEVCRSRGRLYCLYFWSKADMKRLRSYWLESNMYRTG